MFFQLQKIIIWPNSKLFPPRIIRFELGKVNVITGASRTGKSAIIPIIDYCLASSDCFIPIDTIRNYASWYGVIFKTEDGEILIARKVPDGTKVSNDFYLLRGSKLSIPPEIKSANEKIEGIKHILDAISSVPYYRLDYEDQEKGYRARLGFRDLMALIFQTQGIIANQNILFYKTHEHEHRERLRNWFPFILGAIDIDILSARQLHQDVEKRLNQLRRDYDKLQAAAKAWMENIRGEIELAKEYGLLNTVISDSTKPEELLEIINYILENIPEYSQTKLNNIEEANKEILRLETEEERLSTEIGIVKKRLNDIKRLKSGFIDYGNSVQKRVDRLHISKWLEDIAYDSQKCPICGSSENPNKNIELLKVSAAIKKYENESKTIEVIPNSFLREENLINLELEKLLDQKKDNQKLLDTLLAQNIKAQKEFQRSKSMFLFLGHLKASKEMFEKTEDGSEVQKEIENLKRESERLNRMIDPKRIQKKVDSATEKISQRTLNRLKTLDVEDEYNKVPPKFDIKNLNISVKSNDDNWHFLAEVGSASNWVSFHIALMCSLQEYFLELGTSCVPSFVVFDQPSQVYFPRIKRSEENLENDPKYEDEDVVAVRGIFKTLAKSVSENGGSWQCVVLDHADGSIYGDIEGVYEVEEWRNGKKLIPNEWYN